MDDEIPVEAPNQKRDHSGGGGSDFYDVQCVAYGNGYALRATKRLIGRGNADTIGKAAFLIVWDEDGSSHVDKWWVELQYYEW